MKTIYKQVVPITGRTTFSTGSNGSVEILHVALQDGTPTVWYYHQPEFANRDVVLQWFGTGHDIPKWAWYIGTIHDGPFVWHLHDVTNCQKSS